MRPLTPTDAAKIYGVNVPDGMEAIYQPLYDIQAYPTAGFTSKTFFQEPIGQNSKTISDTNMQSAGQLPSPQKFLVQTVEVILTTGVPLIDVVGATGAGANEMYDILRQGALTLTIGSKPYLIQGPLITMPLQNTFVAQFAISTTASTDVSESSYLAAGGPVFDLAKHRTPLWIPTTQNFDVKITFESVLTMTTAGRVGVRLGGLLYRSRQ